MDAPPRTIHWSMLSPKGMEAAKEIALRISAGLSYDEVASAIESHRDELTHLDPPKDGPVTREWVSKSLAQLRNEIRATGAAEF